MNVQQIAEGLAIELANESDTDRLGNALASIAVPDTVIALVGPLGAGKTRLVRAVAESLGVDPQAISSPTFVLHHVYVGRLTVHHFDAYRLGGSEEFAALGVADQFSDGGVCLVEWADRVADILPADAWWITLVADPSEPTVRQTTLRLPADVAEVLAGLL